MSAEWLRSIPAGDLEPTAAELNEARAEMSRARDAYAVYSQCYAALARLDLLAEDLAVGHLDFAAPHVRRLRAVDSAASKRLAELDAARAGLETAAALGEGRAARADLDRRNAAMDRKEASR